MSRIKEREEQSFLGDRQVRCRSYEWTLPEPKRFGALSIEFLCPIGEEPRRFFAKPILTNWTNRASKKRRKQKPPFLERVSACGRAILKLLNALTPEHDGCYPLYASLFRNRSAGHGAINREFGSTVDLVDFSQSSGPELLSPLPGSKQLVSYRQSHQSAANELIRSALATDKGSRSVVDVISMLQEWNNRSTHTSAESTGTKRWAVHLDKFPGRCGLDLLFTDGVARNQPIDFAEVMENVRCSLMPGPATRADFSQAVTDVGYRHAASCILKIAESRTETGFDKWLQNIRQHGYKTLIPGAHSLKGPAREKASSRATTIYYALLWQSYFEMARCYGVVMLVAWLHFCIELELDPVEEQLFRQMHLPQVYLGGLPLAFLGRSQMRWIAGTLLENWSWWRFEPEAYDSATKMLGAFGELVRSRRKADQRLKSGTRQEPEPKFDAVELWHDRPLHDFENQDEDGD